MFAVGAEGGDVGSVEAGDEGGWCLLGVSRLGDV